MPLSELQQMNAVIGLSMRIEGWPSTLAELGYTLDRIELKFKVSEPTRPGYSIHINPDLLFVADVRNFSLIAELKSGRFQDFVQLDRFVRVTPLELIRFGGMPVRDQSQAHSHVICVVEVINQEFIDEYLAEFRRVNHGASLVSIGSSEIRSHHGTLSDSKLDRTLKNGTSLEGCHPPSRLIPVLPTSNDEYALLRSVVDAVKQLWIRNARAVSSADVGRTVFGRLWDRFGREAQIRYVKVVKEVLDDMVQTEFHKYLRPVPEERDRWALLQQPEASTERQRTKIYQQFSNIVQAYKWRRKDGGEYDRRHPAQISFDDWPGFRPQRNEDDKK